MGLKYHFDSQHHCEGARVVTMCVTVLRGFIDFTVKVREMDRRSIEKHEDFLQIVRFNEQWLQKKLYMDREAEALHVRWPPTHAVCTYHDKREKGLKTLLNHYTLTFKALHQCSHSYAATNDEDDCARVVCAAVSALNAAVALEYFILTRY